MLAKLRRYVSDTRGAAAAEFAIWLIVLVPMLLNIIDFGIYAYTRMQVQNAAQMAAQAVWQVCEDENTTCDPSAEVTAALQSTSLGSQITQVGTTTLGQYCPDTVNNELDAGTSCTFGEGADAITVDAGYYAIVTVTYAYSPLFPGVTISSAMSGAMTQTAWSRYA